MQRRVKVDTREVKKILWSAILVVVILLVMNGEKWYWAYYPFKPAILHSIKVTNPNKTVCAGEVMAYDVDIDKKMDVPVTVKRQLINSRVITLTPSQPPWKPLGRQTVPAFAATSKGDDPGVWWMRWTAEYEIGPNGRIVPVHGRSDEYRVIDCDKEKNKGPKGDIGKQGPKGDPGKGTVNEYNLFRK
jgi:hypothetical protein